ncbi:MAG: hypothetical protein ABL892_00640 [Thiobacillaceae bacterium]
MSPENCKTQPIHACDYLDQPEGAMMKFLNVFPMTAALLMGVLPLVAHSAETTAISGEVLSAAGERIRQTGEQIRADLKAAHARVEAKKVRDELERKRELDQAAKDAAAQAVIKENKQRQTQEAAQARARQEATARATQAEHERQLVLEEQRVKEAAANKLLAKERAANALREARLATGEGAFASEAEEKERQLALVTQRVKEESTVKAPADKTQPAKVLTAKDRATIALREARQSVGEKAF